MFVSFCKTKQIMQTNKKQPYANTIDEEKGKVSNARCCGKRTSYAIKGCIFFTILLIVAALVVLPQIYGGFTGNNDPELKPPLFDPTPTPEDVPSHLPPSTNETKNDPRLSQSFYGIDYTPHNTLYHEKCGVTLEDVVEDIKILKQLTTRIRLYGMDCDQGNLVFEAIKRLKANMGVVLTLWVDGTTATYQRQYNTFMKLLKDHGSDNILGVSVGNEAVFRRQIMTKDLIQMIKDVKSKLESIGHPHIPVYTTEIDDLNQLIPAEDAVMDNVHPFFAGTLVEDAANWTWQYYYDVDQYPTMKIAQQLNMNKTQAKPAIISEIGWPSYPNNRKVKAAVPSIDNQRILLETFVCEANRRNLPYFWFEFKDQPWKTAAFNETRESYWGLFDKDRKLKHARLPKCQVDSWKKGNYTVVQPEPLRTRDDDIDQ